ncbi:hypothetical protein OQA88_2589 [Cercophora sp. LCS_1]
MGHTSKFTFPIPGRRSKPAPSPPFAMPQTKAQKILGTTTINNNGATLSPDRWGWESRSNSGISISVSETTTSRAGETGLGIVETKDAGGRDRRWEEESEIIPRALQGQGHQHPAANDAVTDASSLRRRQSSSTITSYYDKSKLPLSISQQTSNSAMAKGLPVKAQALLDIDGSYMEPKTKEKKKPAKLDLSSLLAKGRSSKFLKPDSQRGLVLGPDMITKSPSIMSLSPDATPPPIAQRVERSLRKKLTRESLKELSPKPQVVRQTQAISSAATRVAANRTETGRHRPTKSTVDLINLYDHYEARSFADVMDQDFDGMPLPDKQVPTYPTPPTNSAGNGYLSPQQTHPMRITIPTKQAALSAGGQDLGMSGGMSPSSLVSPPTDNASISSRHTRTSKASKRTDRSMNDLDLQQNSVLSLSSDSEDDGYEQSSKSSLAPPTLSDGQASPTSPRSAISQRSAPAIPQEPARGKVPKRASFATQPQFLPIPEGAATTNSPQVGLRTSSLAMNAAAKKQATLLAHQTSRLSINTTSTVRTVVAGVKSENSPPHQASWSSMGAAGFDDFPTPPSSRVRRQSVSPPTAEEPTPPLSPTSVDFYLQSQRSSRIAFDVDNRSTYSGRSLGSAKGKVRPGSVSSQHDSSGRFMAVTRQEEMLLAALRQKRARMREDILAEFEDTMTHEEEERLERQVTNGSSSGVSRQSSMSTMRTLEPGSLGALTARPQIRVNAGKEAEKTAVREQILLMMDRPSGSGAGLETAEPSPDLDGLLGFDDSMEFPMPERRGSKASSKASVDSASGGSGASSRSRKTALSVSGLRSTPRSREFADHRRSRGSSRRGSEKDIPAGIPEDPREKEEEEADVPRPDSPISPDDFPMSMSMSMSMTRKKQVRLSAVGNPKPNIEAGWWDDSG